MMLQRFIFILISFTFFSVFSQTNLDLNEEIKVKLNDRENELLRQANVYYTYQDFIYAIDNYDTLAQAHPEFPYLSYLLGTCQTYDSNFFDKAETNIKKGYSLREKLFDYDFYLGKAYQNNEKYEDAKTSFESYLKNPLPDTIKGYVLHQIKLCENAIQYKKYGTIANSVNLGSPINDASSEYSAFLPLDERFIVFTYVGPKSKGGKQKYPGKPDKNGIYFEDIFISYKNDSGKWEVPKPIDEINTIGHDAVTYLSYDGQELYLYKNFGKGNGDILVSKLKGHKWSLPEPVRGINSPYWEGSICFSPDEKFVYFSSERPGGLGGRDIWFGQKMADGSYGNIQNLGNTINSALDEDCPFITADGKTLIFASNGPNSIGGYDIFRSDFKNGKWSAPYNIGKPVNSNQDDKYFWVSADGQKGIYSSSTRGGLGQQDIFSVEPALFGKPTSLVVISGKVFLNDKPTEATIKIKPKLAQKYSPAKFSSNSKTGNYLLNLPSENEYDITYTSNGISVTKHINTSKIDSFISYHTNAYLYSEKYYEKLTNLSDSLHKAENITDLKLDSLNTLFGDIKIDSLSFSVQVGAFKYEEHFNYNVLFKLPPIKRIYDQDGITRFTIGNYSNLKEVMIMNKKSKDAGIDDAFIVYFYKGKKIGIKNLITLYSSLKK